MEADEDILDGIGGDCCEGFLVEGVVELDAAVAAAGCEDVAVVAGGYAVDLGGVVFYDFFEWGASVLDLLVLLLGLDIGFYEFGLLGFDVFLAGWL